MLLNIHQYKHLGDKFIIFAHIHLDYITLDHIHFPISNSLDFTLSFLHFNLSVLHITQRLHLTSNVVHFSLSCVPFTPKLFNYLDFRKSYLTQLSVSTSLS